MSENLPKGGMIEWPEEPLSQSGPDHYPINCRPVPPLAYIRSADIIENAGRELAKQRRWKSAPVWFMVSKLTGKGSTTSHQIAKDIGLNPDNTVREQFK